MQHFFKKANSWVAVEQKPELTSQFHVIRLSIANEVGFCSTATQKVFSRLSVEVKSLGGETGLQKA